MLAEEYLSGHVKDKLASAIIAADNAPDLFQRNVEALKQVQPEPLKPEDISFVLGSTWIPVEYYQDFMYEKFQTSTSNKKRYIHIEFAECTGTYFITEKGFEKGSIAANTTYGTKRMNAYEILENTLNLRSVEVRDKDEYYDPDSGEKKIKYVLNRQETLLAREKQAQIKMEFDSWLFADPERGTALTQLYNDRFNNIRPRTFNGDDLILPDMNESITLRKHQRDELEMGISFDTKVLEQLADKLFALRDLIPEQGRIAYQLLPQDCKEMTDQLVEFLLSEVPEIRKCFDCYVDAKYKLSELYATDNKWLKSQKEKYEKEAKKILANRILSGVKTICRLEKEEKGAAYLAKHREYLASRIIMEAMDMLAQAASEQEEAFNRQQNIAGELSKEAKKELFIKNQDKGYEH